MFPIHFTNIPLSPNHLSRGLHDDGDVATQKTSPQSRLYEASIMKIPAMVIGFATGKNLSFVIVALLCLLLSCCTMPFSAMRRLICLFKGFFRQVVQACLGRLASWLAARLTLALNFNNPPERY